MARELVQIPVVLPAFIAHMRTQMAAHGEPVTVASKVPTKKPAKFLRVMQLATQRLSVGHASVTIVVECWATTDEDADNLAALAYPIACNAEITDPYAYCPGGSRGTVNGPYQSVDPDSGRPRTVFTISLTVALAAL